MTLPKEKMKVGKNDEEEYVLDDDANQNMDVREHEEPIDINDAYKDNDENHNQTFSTSSEKYVTVKSPSSTKGSSRTRKKCDVLIKKLCADKIGYVPHMGDAASESHDDMKNVYNFDTEAKNNSTESEEPYEEPVAEVDNTEAHDGDYTTTMLHMKPVTSSSNRSSNSNSACFHLDTPSMKVTCPTTTRNIDHVHTNLPQVTTTALLNEDIHLKEMLGAQLDLIQEQTAMDKRQFLNELLLLKDRIKWLEDKALKLHDGPKEPSDESLPSPNSSREPQRHQKFFLPWPRQDPNKIMVECSIPESVVDVLLVRAKQQDSIMSCLRSICYPATLWIPCREGNNKSQVRRLLFTGWTKQIVDDARVTIYNFICDDIGVNIPNLHPVLCRQNTWETWNKSAPSLETGQTNSYQIQDNLHDPAAHDDTQSKHEGAKWGEMNNTHNEFRDYENNAEMATPEAASNEGDLAAILNPPPVEI
jgi:hypothetical protein